jgi:hypothetical protein
MEHENPFGLKNSFGNYKTLLGLKYDLNKVASKRHFKPAEFFSFLAFHEFPKQKNLLAARLALHRCSAILFDIPAY